MDKEIKTSEWAGRTNYHCPEPCEGKWLSVQQVHDCVSGCARQPKIVARKSPIVGPNGEEIEIVEETTPQPSESLSAVGAGEFGSPTVGGADPETMADPEPDEDDD